MKRIVHWFRRDLRLDDNAALSEATHHTERVIPVFVLEAALRTGPDVGAARLAFLLDSVRSLQISLRHSGSELVVAQGRSEEVLPRLCQELKVEAVFCNQRYEPYARARDNRVAAALSEVGVGFQSFKDAVVWEELEVVTQAGHPYTVFTPYSKAWKAKTKERSTGSKRSLRNFEMDQGKLEQAKSLTTRGLNGICQELPTGPDAFGHPLAHPIPSVGEPEAKRVLSRFLSGPVFEYGTARDYPAQDGTSRLSAHLRAGTIGIRRILRELEEARAGATAAQQKNCDTFLNELIWREFYLQVLANFPHVVKGSFRRQYDGLAWSENQAHYEAWGAGQTGYPIVDAAMRCLNATGWMHNRLRMITAMFLTKDLLLNWQQGERYFMHKLIDGDMAANNGGWQWSAGTGTDAAPYFRIFNPTAQGKRFDPDGAFVRQWVPELANVPGARVHEPWKLVSADRPSYPQRIVLHEEQRAKCLAMYRKAR